MNDFSLANLPTTYIHLAQAVALAHIISINTIPTHFLSFAVLRKDAIFFCPMSTHYKLTVTVSTKLSGELSTWMFFFVNMSRNR